MLQHKSINLVPVQQQNYTWVTERVTFLQEENTKKYEHIQMEVQEFNGDMENGNLSGHLIVFLNLSKNLH